MKEALDKLGIEYSISNEYGNATIHHYEFSDKKIAWRKERSEVTVLCDKDWWAETGWDDICETKCVRQKGHDGNCQSYSGVELNGFYKEKQIDHVK